MTVIKRLKRLAAGLAGLARPRNWNRPGVAAALLAVSQVSQVSQAGPAPDSDAISRLDDVRTQLKERYRAAAAASAEAQEISPADVPGPSPLASDGRMPGLLNKENDVVAQWGDFRDFRNF